MLRDLLGLILVLSLLIVTQRLKDQLIQRPDRAVSHLPPPITTPRS